MPPARFPCRAGPPSRPAVARHRRPIAGRRPSSVSLRRPRPLACCYRDRAGEGRYAAVPDWPALAGRAPPPTSSPPMSTAPAGADLARRTPTARPCLRLNGGDERPGALRLARVSPTGRGARAGSCSPTLKENTCVFCRGPRPPGGAVHFGGPGAAAYRRRRQLPLLGAAARSNPPLPTALASPPTSSAGRPRRTVALARPRLARAARPYRTAHGAGRWLGRRSEGSQGTSSLSRRRRRGGGVKAGRRATRSAATPAGHCYFGPRPPRRRRRTPCASPGPTG
jgi:hypothetical protein